MEGGKETVAKKFAILLRRNTHRMTFLLMYTLLEWILIALLLLNGLFSYIIFKFACFFGLKPPCLFCSRIDHVFESSKDGNSCRDLLCESHVGELSKLSFCSIHRRLAKAGDMCEDCAASRPGENDRSFGLLSWMKRSEQGEKDLRCSCCGVVLENGFYSPFFLKTEAWDVLDCTQKDKSVEVATVEDKGCSFGPEETEEGSKIPSYHCERNEEQKQEKGEQGELNDICKSEAVICLPSVTAKVMEASVDILTIPTEKIDDMERILPIELIDSSTMLEFRSIGDHRYHLELPKEAMAKISSVIDVAIDAKQIAALSSVETVVGDKNSDFEIATFLNKDSFALLPTMEPPEDCSNDTSQLTQLTSTAEIVAPQDNGNDEELQGSEEHGKASDDANCEISIGSEICDQEQMELALDETASQPEVTDDLHIKSSSEAIMGEPVSETESPEQTSRSVKHLMVCPAIHEFEEERMPETPTTPNSLSLEAFAALHKRFLLERRESGTESLDGSIASDIDNLDSLSIDRLKAILKAERRVMSALFMELEEERSASAIAANQTMAMITRLQEEKAAVQMEALQYQRMMEEQSEYDQEALQLLNELMVKREKEKLELEKELELYRHKVHKYENTSRGKLTKGSRSETSSTADDSDEGSYGSYGSHEGEESNQNTPTSDALGSMEEDDRVNRLVTLDESLAEFEEERLSILEQLKALEERLFSVEEEDVYLNAKPIERFLTENCPVGNGEHESLDTDANGGHMNGSLTGLDTKGRLHRERRSSGIRRKKLLPLFDATNFESKVSINHEAVKSTHLELSIAEEVDNVHERLQALEEDREFLKHCISSLKKGERGMGLLQEILQHLRDLKTVELSARHV
ncbi:hypothetical protein HPP92_003711 [Vanilla planifolia]|uniref:GTD-binding domain-containing protein n=1 Tax=Vanilla planifolia TaxID=51239 RepID=A0A835S8L8_VANPL|nr:hypothetical protein HPP92_003711 [Vanilla planifolia]